MLSINRMKAGAAAALAASVLLVPGVPAGATSIPTAPRSVRMIPGNTTATVRWRAPADDGGHPVTGYEVIPYLNNFALPTNFFHSTVTTQVIFGLENGKTYTFKVAAKNADGFSRLSARSAGVTIGVPLASPKPTAVPGPTRATVSWRAPANNGAAIDSFRVTALVDGDAQATKVFASVQTHEVIGGLKGGQRYTFEVAAHNSRGWGATSNQSAAVVVGK